MEWYFDYVKKCIGAAFVETEKHMKDPDGYCNEGNIALSRLRSHALAMCKESECFHKALEGIVNDFETTVPIEVIKELLKEGTLGGQDEE